jgi:hypothetical protein
MQAIATVTLNLSPTRAKHPSIPQKPRFLWSMYFDNRGFKKQHVQVIRHTITAQELRSHTTILLAFSLGGGASNVRCPIRPSNILRAYGNATGSQHMARPRHHCRYSHGNFEEGEFRKDDSPSLSTTTSQKTDHTTATQPRASDENHKRPGTLLFFGGPRTTDSA